MHLTLCVLDDRDGDPSAFNEALTGSDLTLCIFGDHGRREVVCQPDDGQAQGRAVSASSPPATDRVSRSSTPGRRVLPTLGRVACESAGLAGAAMPAVPATDLLTGLSQVRRQAAG